jgi:L-threonylcarbamoyladenylate synthase
MIESIIGKVEVNAQSSSQPLAPGMLKSHYAPTKKMMSIEDFDKADIPDTKGFAYLGYAKYDSRFNRDYQVLLSEEESLNDAAKNLFTSLRALDQNPHIHTIVVSYVPEVGLGRAINDRLRRATAH